MWFAVTALLNGALAAWSAGRVDIGSRAVEWSLAAFCIAVAARHDGIVRGVFMLGRLVPSYRLHQLAYHLGQLHRAMARPFSPDNSAVPSVTASPARACFG